MSQTKINQLVRDEISRIAEVHDIDADILEDFAGFVIKNHEKKDANLKPLTLTQLKEAIYKRFGVKGTKELKQSGSFKMATDGMDDNDLDLIFKDTWEKLYRKFVGIIPGEENKQGYGCINGIDIFDYFKPWQVFGLNPKTAKSEDIKKAYHKLSKVYHPDVPGTGDAKIFDRINTMYKSINAEA